MPIQETLKLDNKQIKALSDETNLFTYNNKDIINKFIEDRQLAQKIFKREATKTEIAILKVFIINNFITVLKN